MANEITIYLPPDALMLPDNAQWTNRFDIHSSSSNRTYTIIENEYDRKGKK